MVATIPPPPSIDAVVALAQAHGVDPAHVQAHGSLWTFEVLKPGAAWRRRGQKAKSVAWVIDGEIGSFHSKLVIDQLGPGELLGTVPAITHDGAHRTDLVAGRRTVLATLTSEALLELRNKRDPLYVDLLALELRCAIGRIRRVDARIAAIRIGTFTTLTRPPESVLGRLWRTIRRRDAGDAAPPLEPLLRGLPGFAKASAAIVQELAAGFTPRVFQEKQLITAEGEDDPSLYLLADGQLDVLRVAAKGEGSLLLARIDRGTLFGMASLISRTPHTRTAVAIEPACVYILPAARYDRLSTNTRRMLDECLATVMDRQLRSATRSLIAAVNVFQSAAPDAHGDHDKSLVMFMTAHGQLEGGRASTDDADD
jgi:CRP-like cAMP-binding protein